MYFTTSIHKFTVKLAASLTVNLCGSNLPLNDLLNLAERYRFRFMYRVSDITYFIGRLHSHWVKYTDDAIDLVMKNLTLSGRNY
jgi:hypothetical protein